MSAALLLRWGGAGSLLLGITVALAVPLPARAACSALPSNRGGAVLSFSIPTTGSYRVWA